MVNYFKLFSRIVQKKGNNPIYLIHFVTSRCNAQCNFCFYWEQLNQTKNELTLEEIDKVTRSFDKDLYQVILTGGEPFLRKELADIAIIYHKNAGVRKIALISTGFLTTRIINDVNKILKACPGLSISINLSINHLYEDMEKETKLKDHFNRLLDTYNGLVEIKKHNKNLGIYALTTHTKTNQNKLNDIYAFIKGKMPEAVFNINLIRGNPQDMDLKDINISKYVEITQRMKFDRKFNDHSPAARLAAAKNLLRNDIIVNTFRESRYITPCYAGALTGVLYDGGDVFCCELLDKRIGNLRDHDYSFKKVWNSHKANEIRNFIRDRKCFCTHECFYTTNLMFNPSFYPRLIIDALKFKKP